MCNYWKKRFTRQKYWGEKKAASRKIRPLVILAPRAKQSALQIHLVYFTMCVCVCGGGKVCCGGVCVSVCVCGVCVCGGVFTDCPTQAIQEYF